MAEKKEKRYYPLREEANKKHVNLEEVSEEVYKGTSPEIWREQKRRQASGQCRCPKSKLWACDLDCEYCRYQAAGNQVSLDAPLEDASGLTIADTIPSRGRSPEDIVIDMFMMDALLRELKQLDPEGRRMCKLFSDGISESESARIMGMPRMTYVHHWEKVKAQLYEKLKEWKD